MRLEYCLPTGVAHRLISIHCGMPASGGDISDTVPALLPQLHIRLGGWSRYTLAGKPPVASPAVALIGAMSGAFGMEVSADADLVIAGFLPQGWHALVGVPALQLTDTVLDGGALWPESAVARLIERLAAEPAPLRRGALVEQFLIERCAHAVDGRERRIEAVDAWLERSRGLSVDRLVDSLDLGARQVERLTQELHGLSPKMLAMKYRALRSAATLAIRDADGMAQALDGYADQSHMIRDFHRFVGCTPGNFLRGRQQLARASMEGRWAAGARRPLTLWS